MSVVNEIAAEISKMRMRSRMESRVYFSDRLAYRVTEAEYTEVLRELDALQLHEQHQRVKTVIIMGMEIIPTYEGQQ